MFDLPASGVADGEPTPLVALVMPMRNMGETYVFFDDARYTLGNEVSVSAFSSHLSERAAKTEGKTLLVLADKSVTCDQLMQMATVARKCGLQRILFANKRAEGRSE
jgi:biopolymer transport protein ExbD